MPQRSASKPSDMDSPSNCMLRWNDPPIFNINAHIRTSLSSPWHAEQAPHFQKILGQLKQLPYARFNQYHTLIGQKWLFWVFLYSFEMPMVAGG